MAFRMSQAVGEAAEFQRIFGNIIRELNPEYYRNPSARGIRLEFLREIWPGAFASHNVLCWKGTYYHGFAITLHQELSNPYLLSPLTIGGRFDINNSSKRAYFRDIEPDKKWPYGSANFSDSHNFRRGWEGIAEKCSRIAENEMLPFYLAKIENNKWRLLQLLERAFSSVESPIPTEVENGTFVLNRDFDYDMMGFVEAYNANIAESEKFLTGVVSAKPELFNRIAKTKSLSRLLTSLAG